MEFEEEDYNDECGDYDECGDNDECGDIELNNNELLSVFENWLTKKGLSQKTIHKHLFNVRFFINDYLLYCDEVEARDGIPEVSMYLGYWFIKKAMWSSPAAIKDNAASLKKFYQFMLEKGEITMEDFSELKETITEDMPEWITTMERYLDENIRDMDDVWGF